MHCTLRWVLLSLFSIYILERTTRIDQKLIYRFFIVLLRILYCSFMILTVANFGHLIGLIGFIGLSVKIGQRTWHRQHLDKIAYLQKWAKSE